MLEIAIILLAALGAGLLATSLAERLSGGAAGGRRRQGRHVRAASLLSSVARSVPQTAQSRSEAESALARCGIRMSPAGLVGARIVSLAAGLLVGILLAAFGGANFAARASAVLLGVVLGAVAPQLYLLARRRSWREEIERELPNALDLLTICVQAGSTFDSGLRTVSTRSQGALAEALGEVVQASAFMPTTTALKRLADNAQVQPLTIFVASLIQAEASGIQLADVLKTQAESVRTQRRLALEEKINLLPLKMTFPLIFIFASLLIIILSPVIIVLFTGLAGV